MTQQEPGSTNANKPARKRSSPRPAAPQEMEPLYLRVAQILRRYSFARSTFYALMKQDKLPRPFHPTGNRLAMWSASELDEAVARLRFALTPMRTKAPTSPGA
jgi:predicted DNA-binding transcriptional regulator AlpA